jgi:Na+/H+-dicarboxylate symporter/ABC-type amino acid transport substrate-binding protein
MSSRIAAGLTAGGAVGLFFGERAAGLQIVADAYIKLLQMTVLPYLIVSIVGGLGALGPAQAKTLGTRVGALLLVLWAVALGVMGVFPLMLPAHESASFFSTTLVQEREPFDFLNLYIPTNPFYSLANSVVPAVVLFSLVLGVALIAVPEKAQLLEVLRVAAAAIARATSLVVALTPYGVFAIGAVVAGTLSFDELQRLEAYLIGYVGLSLLLGLWVLPGLVAALTPIPHRALIARTRDALVMAFMTTSLFAVLPLLAEDARQLVREYARKDASPIDVIVPASFNFPHAGKILALSFVPFAAWFAGTRVGSADFPRLAGTGLVAMFGSGNAAVPFLLDLFRVPADTFRLFVTSGIVNARFGTLVAAVHTLAIAILGTCAVTGALTVDVRRLARFGVVTVALTAALVAGTRLFLQVTLDRPYEKGLMLASMSLLEDRGPVHLLGAAGHVAPLPAAATSVLDRVRTRGAVRIGYFEDSLPYVFLNLRHELVGFDVEMGLQLARDLGVRAEFVAMPRSALENGVDPSTCDLVMSGVAITADRALRLRFSSPYLLETFAFLVPDHRAAAFSDWATIRAMGPLRVGVPRAPYFIQKVRDELSGVEVVPIDRMDDMFAPDAPPIDALVTTAERGSAYTLLHPAYSVAVPKPRPARVPLAYVVAGRDQALAALLDTWIELKREDGTIDQLFAHWILGQSSSRKRPRWSVIRDVLHWVA